MALATQADVEAVLARDLTVAEEDGVASLLDRAADLVVGFLRQQPPNPTPGPVIRVVAEMAAAAMLRGAQAPPNIVTQNAGPFGVTYVADSTSAGPWLTNAMKLRLRPYRMAAVSMRCVGEGYSVP